MKALLDIYKSACALEHLAQQIFDETATIYALLDELGFDNETAQIFEEFEQKRANAKKPDFSIESCI